MPQMMEPRKKRKKPSDKDLEFDAGKVFDMKPAVDLDLDRESAEYSAQKGEGGDRRA